VTVTPAEQQAIPTAARRLATSERTRIPCAPVRDLIGDDIATAYRVQSINAENRLASRVVGRKIGLTSPAAQDRVGASLPHFGTLFDDMDCTDEKTITSDRLLQPRIEAEIAIVLSHDIVAPITAEQAPSFVTYMRAALEIVDSRINEWDISLADTVADNASSGLYVLGGYCGIEDAPDLDEVQMSMAEDGIPVSRGTGSDCWGSPWNALTWLANTALEHGTRLRTYDIVLTGALGPAVTVKPGATYTATISGIGSVTAGFSE